MGRWERHAFFKTEVWEVGSWCRTGLVGQTGSEEQAAKVAAAHNADCDAYEAKIAELESRLARIAALVRPIPVADLVEAGTEAPRLLAERHRQIRAILEEENNG